MRIDEYIKNNFKVTRSRAQLLISEDRVKLNGVIINKPSYKFKQEDKVEIDDYKYVSRAGYKLEYAYGLLKDKYKIDLTDKMCLDIGSSTGGFTDFLLQSDAKEVVAVDVGTDQFDKSLIQKYNFQNSKKIKLFESTDIRNTNFKERFDIIVCDVSFISLSHIIPKIAEYLKESSCGIILFKPQFEVGQNNLKNGIVKDQSVASEYLEKIKTNFEKRNLKVLETFESGIKGGDGNVEYIMFITK